MRCLPKSWMVYMENPTQTWMIWRYPFQESSKHMVGFPGNILDHSGDTPAPGRNFWSHSAFSGLIHGCCNVVPPDYLLYNTFRQVIIIIIIYTIYVHIIRLYALNIDWFYTFGVFLPYKPSNITRKAGSSPPGRQNALVLLCTSHKLRDDEHSDTVTT